MSKTKDTTPIQTQRINRTGRIELIYSATEVLEKVLAHRWQYTMQGSTQLGERVYLGTIEVPLASISNAITAKLTDLNTLIDSLDI